MIEIRRRRDSTEKRIKLLREKLKDAESIVDGKACVYATGSFGRREAGDASDLDLFIVGMRNGVEGRTGIEGSKLKRLDDICVKADLISATRAMSIPDFDGDGKYLVHYSVHEFTKTLGTPEDDVTNTFTARLLLLLESTPLIGAQIRIDVIEEVLAAYWRDYEDHKDEFVPAFLANDILRLWRTFCINYEARTEREPDEKKIKGKIKNYKLKHSRLLTCYSALLYLLTIFREIGTVSPADAMFMISISPTERLEWLLTRTSISAAHRHINNLLKGYESFLKETSISESELMSIFGDKKASFKYMKSAYGFGDEMFEAVNSVGQGNRFHRVLVV